MKDTIKTNERIFEVSTFEDTKILCNLDGFYTNENGELLTKDGESIRSVRHYWNNEFQRISKKEIKEML